MNQHWCIILRSRGRFLFEDLCAKSMYQGQGQVFTSHRYSCILLLSVPSIPVSGTLANLNSWLVWILCKSTDIRNHSFAIILSVSNRFLNITIEIKLIRMIERVLFFKKGAVWKYACRLQAITWSNTDFSLMEFYGIHMKALLHECSSYFSPWWVLKLYF